MGQRRLYKRVNRCTFLRALSFDTRETLFLRHFSINAVIYRHVIAPMTKIRNSPQTFRFARVFYFEIASQFWSSLISVQPHFHAHFLTINQFRLSVISAQTKNSDTIVCDGIFKLIQYLYCKLNSWQKIVFIHKKMSKKQKTPVSQFQTFFSKWFNHFLIAF